LLALRLRNLAYRVQRTMCGHSWTTCLHWEKKCPQCRLDLSFVFCSLNESVVMNPERDGPEGPENWKFRKGNLL
jgi:hypothetical protein